MYPEVANAFKARKYLDWVRTKASKLDMAEDLPAIIELSEIMKDFRKANSWDGVSSNNIYWQKTPSPISLIQVPLENSAKNFVTIVNPVLSYPETDFYIGRDGCGSLIGLSFYTLRPNQLSVKGYVLEDYLKGDKTIKQIKPEPGDPCRILEHEVDHLNGRLLSDHGIVGGFIEENPKLPYNILRLLETAPEKRSDEDFSLLSKNLTLKRFNTDYLPKNHLSLSLNTNHDNFYWELHTSGCLNSSTRDQLKLVFPDIPTVRYILADNYTGLGEIMEEDSFSSLPLTICDCIDK